MSTYTYANQLTVIECAQCHMDFAMSKEFERDRRRDHQTFYCPAGHAQFFSAKSDVETEREARERAERIAASRLATNDRLLAEVEHEKARTRGYQGQLVKTKRRIAKGVCPCCNRQFVDMERHMQSKHPDFGAPS